MQPIILKEFTESAVLRPVPIGRLRKQSERRSMSTSNLDHRFRKNVDSETRRVAQRTAFVARFIVLREGRRSRAHRKIEEMIWSNETTVEALYEMFRAAFINNGDKLEPVDRDLNRALAIRSAL